MLCRAVCLSLLLPPLLFGTEFFVGVGGDDGGPGTRAQPFATVARAQAAVRTVLAAGPVPVTVTIGEGVYPLAEPLVFTAADSGTAACPVVYRGEGTVVLSGARRIVGFAPIGKLWITALPQVAAGEWYFHRLVVNGGTRPRARIPDAGTYFRVLAPLAGDEATMRRGFHFREGDVQEWRNIEDAVFVVYGSWYNTIHHVERLDMTSHAVAFTNLAARPFNWYERNLRYYVENVPEVLDQPGEWYLDRHTGQLSYYPLPGEDLATCQVFAPVLRQTLVRFHGDPGGAGYVEHIHLENLEFRHADAHLPKDLYDSRQAATSQTAAVLLDGARHCQIEGCVVANVGEHGLWLRDDCHHNTVRRCHLHDLGGGGIYVGSSWRWGDDTPGWRGYREASEIPHTTEHNLVDNCFIHQGGLLFTGAVGIWIGQAAHTQITHNRINDFPYSGISVGWDWSGRQPGTAHHNRIENNHIHHIGLGRMNDLAGIYTLGVSPGTVIRRNLIHDVQAYQSPVGYCLGAGIYLDQSSAEILIEENICHTIANAGFFLHYGANNHVRNNVFADLAGLGRIGWGINFSARRGRADRGNSASGNIVAGTSAKMAKTQQSGEPEQEAYDFIAIDRNLYFPTPGEAPRFSISAIDAPEGMLGWEEWREQGYDAHSLVTDPGFVDAANHDYRLRPDSPALALGIRSIDLSEAGLYGPPEWTSLPDHYTPRPAETVQEFQPSNPLNLFEDYETQPVGQVPVGAQFTDPERGATVAVTDATAAPGGSRSLRFIDAPGLSQPYHPNRVWRNIRFPEGTVRIGFDAMNSPEQPATFLVELRDWTKQPHLPGPSLTFLPEGGVQVGQRLRLPAETGRWYRVEIEFSLGENQPKSYRLRFGPSGEEAETIEVPFVESEFNILTWLGFVAMDADRAAVFHLDNLRIEMF